MKRSIVCWSVLLSISGCASEAVTEQSPFAQAADELEAVVAALQEMSDEDADDTISDEAMDKMSAARNRRGHRHEPRRARGPRDRRANLLIWYGDLDALQACRDQADGCADDDDDCRSEVRACVQDVFDGALTAMCEEKTAECEADDAPARECGRITAVCSGDAGIRGRAWGSAGNGGQRRGRGQHDSAGRRGDHDGGSGWQQRGQRGERDDWNRRGGRDGGSDWGRRNARSNGRRGPGRRGNNASDAGMM
ncbi:MAG: hypothetical protein OXR73_19395 [Myxococcales bacterium]|nr:hypothetical protein [Myxococcales bacterium]